MNFTCNLPINSTSFGSISVSLLREIYSRAINCPIFPIANSVDLKAQKRDDGFFKWLETNINNSLANFDRKLPCLKLWHCNLDSLASLGNDEHFITFIETDSITDAEKAILKQKKTVFVTSSFLKGICTESGLNNVKYLPLGFDSVNFYQTNKKYFQDGRIVINLLGKWEHRKHTAKIIKAFARKYGNNPRYFLQCAVYNPFLVQRHPNGQVIDNNLAIINQCLEGKKYFNINFLGWTETNSAYNDFLNSANIVLGVGGGENFGAGEFHSVALGKHALILNAGGFKDWATNENSILIQPSGKIDAQDGVFFGKGPFQQGNFFTWEEDAFITGLEETIKRYQSNHINTAGLELQNRTYKQTLDTIIKEF